MYIEDRLFSETSDEVFYSVTMTEEEYNLFSEFQKEFASVRLMKKQGKKLFDAAIQGDRKSAGKINAIVMKNGGGKNITVNSVGRGAQKISNGIAEKVAKTSGVPATPELKKEIYQKGVENNLALARMMKASGGKLPKWQ